VHAVLAETGSSAQSAALRCLARRPEVDPSFDGTVATMIGMPSCAEAAAHVLEKLPPDRLRAQAAALRAHLTHADLRSHRAAACLLRALR
jgi:hypothetical protein